MTEEQWKINIGQRLLSVLPSNDLTSAMALADAWLVANGGWDAPNEQPTGGQSDDTVVAAIQSAEIGKTKTLTITVPISVQVAAVGNFASGTLQADMVTALQSAVQSRIGSLFGRDGSKVLSYTWGSATSSLRSSGSLSASDMQAVETQVAAGGNLIDPAAIATERARLTHSLDNTWVCSSLYTRGNSTEPVMAFVTKFTTSSYTVASSVGYIFAVSLGRASGAPASVTRIDS